MPLSNVSNTAVYSSTFPYSHNAHMMPYEECPLDLEWLQLLHSNCTLISYKVRSHNSLEMSKKCYVSFRATYPDDSFYVYLKSVHWALPPIMDHVIVIKI